MLTRLVVNNLTVFGEADFRFAAGLNVIVGENGTGKSHLLKVAYTALAIDAHGERDSGSPKPTKNYLATAISKKLRGVFRPDSLGRLTRRQPGRARCGITAELKPKSLSLGYEFHSASKEVTVTTCPEKWTSRPPVYLPTRELLTIYPGFVSLYETTDLPFEETWRDTCILLGAPLSKGPRLSEVKPLLEPLEQQLGGSVVLEDGRFYVRTVTGNLEAALVAEGLRKLAMIARLIATGSLAKTGALFWDEPEANLNPKIIRQVARTIVQLAADGIQVFIASHSLFLLRELDILLREGARRVSARFFGLHPSSDGVRVEQGDTIDDIGNIDALDEELSQSNRYLTSETK